MSGGATNPLQKLATYGQSPWLDNINRRLITSGDLGRLVDDGIRGVTSNPTIFNKAIAEGQDYDDQLAELAGTTKSADAIFEAMAVRDLQTGCDVFRPLYEQTNGADGFVSIEVAPELAYDTPGTIAMARHLHEVINRPNLLVKIPATPEGVPAIEQMIAEGRSINVTLIFALEAYEDVADAYITGLERLVSAGKPLDRVASVASFFVSRVDTAVDKRLDAKLKTESEPKRQEELRALHGKAGIANSQLAYEIFERIFNAPRFQALRAKGAHPQRVLWASTSVKNPAYPELMYVEALVGPDTVDTMPPATVDAYKLRGKPVANAVRQNLAGAHATIDRLEQAGISMREVTDVLIKDGVKLFADSYNELIAGIGKKAEAMRQAKAARQPAAAGRA